MPPSPSERTKPRKPYTGFPLTPHPNGQWCKKIRGKVHFFGTWDDPMGALENYNSQAADLHAGRRPRPRLGSGLTVKDLANKYMAYQEEKAKRGLITLRWYEDCTKIIRAYLRQSGHRRWDDLRPEDFAEYRLKLYDRYGVCAIDRAITVIRSLFKFAFEYDLVDRPLKFGDQFKKPTAKEKRLSRANRDRAHGKKLFTPEQIRELMITAQQPLRAMVLLGINGGFGNTDCAELPLTAVDLKGGVIEYERAKTGIQRIVPLWPETIEAIQESLSCRPKPRCEHYANFMFLTLFGNPWKKERLDTEKDGVTPRVGRQQAVSAEFHKLLKKLKYNRKGLGFYALRHTFRTWADETKDQHAVHRIMGHALPGMSGVYVEEVSLERLKAVTDYVRLTIFTDGTGSTPKHPESNPSPPPVSDASELESKPQTESHLTS